MSASSGSAEGSPDGCPVCGSMLTVDPSLLYGEEACPDCGVLLWFIRVQGRQRLFDAARISLAERQRVERELASHQEDSLSEVELIMLLEELEGM